MSSDDDFVGFRYVRIVSSTAAALFCAIGDRRVWLPRLHVRGRLGCRGDRGNLLIRRWVAVDRHLIDPQGAVPLVRAIWRSRVGQLRLVPATPGAPRGD